MPAPAEFTCEVKQDQPVAKMQRPRRTARDDQNVHEPMSWLFEEA
jgi:hypothetical protein